MEEKERYELFGEFGIIHDTSPNAECMLLNKFQTCEILNRQDKENQQLKQQLAEKDKQIKILEDFGEQKRKAIVRLQKNKSKINTEFTIQQLQRVKEKTKSFYGEYSASVVVCIIDQIIKEIGDAK